ncbi:MAG: NAD(P)/FAD-dependent oxidoreductase [Granulosicoccus sp.]|nr:NAD(P)/FAD-dependent oxidoreductase [Granulosicoccus sp.]
MKKHYDAIIVGGGAAGLMCAWQAGRQGQQVVVLERSKKIGRKILMSGGGRCNFTNLYVEADNFICSNPHFVKSALSQYTAWDFIGSVIAHDIAYHERDHGQLFCDDKARDIVNLLRTECETAGVDIILQCLIDSIVFETRHQHYQLTTSLGTVTANALVVATGGLSIPHMDPTPFGYDVARQFGISVLPVRASLVPYTFTGQLKEMFSRLSGNAIPAIVKAGKHHFREALLFTHRGLSGPVILQISNYWQESESIQIDLLPETDLSDILHNAKRSQPRSLARTIIAQLLPKNVVLEFEKLWWPELQDRPIADWPNAQIDRVGNLINRWEIVPAGTEGYRTAEVTLGGVDTNELSSKTMEAKRQPGLYFIGEVVDVTGHLGGFNFQWAWSSAYACAQALAKPASA